MAETFQAIVAAPGFYVGVRCDEMEIHALRYLAEGAEQAPTNALAAEAVAQLCAYIDAPDFVFGLPLRASGTTYQRRVWDEVARIPCRHTRTYGEVAKALHSGPRAVGQACGANPFPLVVPCHRVIAAGGAIGGFGGFGGSGESGESGNSARCGGGFMLAVKRWLLAHESR